MIAKTKPDPKQVVRPIQADEESTGALVSVAPIPQNKQSESAEETSDDNGPSATQLTINWRDVVGKTRFEIIKSLLAVFGCAAVLVRLLRWFG